MAQTYKPYGFENFPLEADWYVVQDDFDKEYPLTTNLPVSATSPYVGTALAVGTFAQTTDEKFGVAVFSGAATTDNSGVQIQRDMETFSITASKYLQFMTKLKLSDGTQDEFFAGLGITDTTFLDGTGTLAGGLTHTDSVGFYKPDGESNVYGVMRRDSVTLATGAYAITGTSYNVFSFEVRPSATAGTAKVLFMVNGVVIGDLDSTTAPQEAEEILTPTLAFVTGDASGTKTMTVDYYRCRQER